MTLDKGYVTIDRTWTPGDKIALNLPMPVRRVLSNDQVIANRDRVALQRGPIVYAAEWPDNPNGKVRNIVLPDANAMTTEFRGDLLNGVQVIRGRAIGLALDEKGAVPQSRAALHGHPLCDVGQSRPRTNGGVAGAHRAAARPTPFPTVATTSTIAASPIPNGRGKNPRNIIDGEEPANSADSSAYFDWWPVQGSANEWVELTFAKTSTVSSAEVYWFDDTGRGGVRVPASWRLLYKSGDQWLPVTPQTAFATPERLERGELHAGHDHGAADRTDDAAGILGSGPARMESERLLNGWRCISRVRLQHAEPQRDRH